MENKNIYSKPLYSQEQVENAFNYAMEVIKEKIFSTYPPYDPYIVNHDTIIINYHRDAIREALYGIDDSTIKN